MKKKPSQGSQRLTYSQILSDCEARSAIRGDRVGYCPKLLWRQSIDDIIINPSDKPTFVNDCCYTIFDHYSSISLVFQKILLINHFFIVVEIFLQC